MTPEQRRGGWVIVLSFITAMLLTLLPMPDWAAPFRPDWVMLILLYWCIALPERVGVGIGWAVGLLLDVIKGSLLGEHALAVSVITYLCLKLHRHLRIYPLWRQSLGILVLISLAHLVRFWIRGITGTAPEDWHYWASSLVSMLLWPWIYFTMRDVRRRFRVS